MEDLIVFGAPEASGHPCFNLARLETFFLSCFIPDSSMMTATIICLARFTDLRLNDGILLQVFNSIVDFQ